MIQIYTGVPGAGKTYKMVADLDVFLSKNPDINLVANIRNLKFPHENFDDLLLECFPDKSLTVQQRVEKFFEYDYQKELNDKFGGPIMYVLDECQSYFPKRTSLPNAESYFQRHRHLGHYLYLATQTLKSINSNIVGLIELEYYAVRRSLSLFGEMHYRVQSPQSQEVIKKFAIRPKKRIFGLYKSFESEEITKPTRELLLKLWPFLLLPIAAFFFYDRVLNTDKKVERLTGNAPASATPAPPQQSQQPSSNRPPVSQPVTEERERVFLQVVKQGSRLITIDPETNAIVDLHRIAKNGRKVTCNGLSCYYDKLINDGLTVPLGTSPYGSFGSGAYNSAYSLTPYLSNKPLPTAGPGNFVDATLVPAPDFKR